MNLVLRDNYYTDINSVTNLSSDGTHIFLNAHDSNWDPSLFYLKIENGNLNFIWKKLLVTELGITASSFYFDGTYLAICAFLDGFFLYLPSETGLTLVDRIYNPLDPDSTYSEYCVKIDGIWHVSGGRNLSAYRLNGSVLELRGNLTLSNDIQHLTKSVDGSYIYLMTLVEDSEPNVKIVQYNEDILSYNILGSSEIVISSTILETMYADENYLYIGTFSFPYEGVYLFRHNIDTQTLEFVRTIENGLRIFSLTEDSKYLYIGSFEIFKIYDKSTLTSVYSEEVEGRENEYIWSDNKWVIVAHDLEDNNGITLYELIDNKVDFSTDQTIGNANLTVHFNDLSEGEIVSWYWDFGDGEYSTEQNPVHTYRKAGIFTVTLTVTFSDDSIKTEIKNDYITCLLVADFKANNYIGYVPLVVNFEDTSLGQPTSWTWDFGDGSTSEIQNPTHIYMQQGKFTVTLYIYKDTFSSTIAKDIITYKIKEIKDKDRGAGFMRGNGPTLIFD